MTEQLKKPAQQRFATGLLLAIVGSIAFSGKAIIVKLAYRYGVDAVTLIMYRMLFALPIFAVMAWWSSRGKAALTRNDWLGILGLGFTGYYLASYLDFAGLAYISAALERLILYLNPTLVMILGWLLYKKKMSSKQIGAMALSYAGILLVFGHEINVQAVNNSATVWGALLVFGSAVSYAIYLSYSGEMVKRLGSLRLVGLATTVACLLCIAQFAVLRPLSAMVVAPQVLWLSLLNATLCTALPVLAVMMAIERIGAPLTAQTGMIGPMSTILMGAFILGEPLNLWIIAGTVLVLAGVYMVSRSRPVAMD
jgi:drug/metabolite transporter (DMT)-like permease